MSIKFWWGSRRKNLIGVDIGSSSVKVVQLHCNGRRSPQLVKIGLEPIPDGSVVNGVIISKKPVSAALERIFRSCGFRNPEIATSISGHAVIVKKVRLPLQTDQELRASILWEAERYMPFDISEVHLDYQVLNRDQAGHSMEVLLVAARKDQITDYTEVLSMAGQEPSLVDVDAFALQNAFKANYPSETQTGVGLLNVGKSTINVSIAEGNMLLFVRDIPMGGERYNQALQQEFNLSRQEAEEWKAGIASRNNLQPAIRKSLDATSRTLTHEILKTLDFFMTSPDAVEIQTLYLSGGASRTPGLKACLQEELGIPTDNLDPFKGIEVNTKNFPPGTVTELAPRFAVAVGLALRSERDR